MKRICVLILVLLWAWSVIGNSSVPGDSVGVRNVAGKTLIVYKMSAGETAYAVSRKYGIPFKELAAANTGVDMGALKAGQEIVVPVFGATASAPGIKEEPAPVKKDVPVAKEEVPVNKEPVAETPQKQTTVIKDPVLIKEEVKPAEQHTAPDPVKTDTPIETAAVTSADNSSVLATTDLSTQPVTPADKSKSFAQLYAEYMSTDMLATSEKGVATWIENNGIQTSGDRFYCLHSTAPIGSIVKVRNLMNNRTIYAKVIGNLSESEVSEKVLIKLSAGAGERLNVLDNRFVVEITYYVADDKAMK